MQSPLDKVGSFYVFLEAIHYDVNEESLWIEVSCAKLADEVYRAKPKSGDETEDRIEKVLDGCREIITDENSPRYRISFEHVFYHQVCEEFDYDMSKEKCDDNGVVGIIEDSSLLAHLKNDTEVFWHCERSKMYVVATSSKWLRVVSSEPPEITLVESVT
ncbi:hypothetical protein [Thalassomonas sp. RHCl1]|uniref:hypothetical protein n=1 Tax=Thalassomonas sp. RHCl1 TaxID=2995320 RepID=UPI00248C69F8|nr:hypothetical protein [Thalassomonas sp. RHCl1]